MDGVKQLGKYTNVLKSQTSTEQITQKGLIFTVN